MAGKLEQLKETHRKLDAALAGKRGELRRLNEEKLAADAQLAEHGVTTTVEAEQKITEIEAQIKVDEAQAEALVEQAQAALDGETPEDAGGL
ncbi:MAG: hypothetical protein ACYC63_04975 [Armatimonadota bacterium]